MLNVFQGLGCAMVLKRISFLTLERSSTQAFPVWKNKKLEILKVIFKFSSHPIYFKAIFINLFILKSIKRLYFSLVKAILEFRMHFKVILYHWIWSSYCTLESRWICKKSFPLPIESCVKYSLTLYDPRPPHDPKCRKSLCICPKS